MLETIAQEPGHVVESAHATLSAEASTSPLTRFGFVAFIGCPNAGKSTLMNACVGQKIAGVSAKPQTTRNRIIGLIQGDRTQIAVLDTPGLQRGVPGEPKGALKSASEQSRLTRYMNKEAWGSIGGADVICYLIDGVRGVCDRDQQHLEQLLKRFPEKTRVLITKSDKIPALQRKALLSHVRDVCGGIVATKVIDDSEQNLTNVFDQEVSVSVISAKIPADVDAFIEQLGSLMPAGPHHYDRMAVTDRSPAFICSELVREQVFRCLGQELPYGTAVKIETLDTRPDGSKYIAAAVFVPKDSHKGIIIGKHGSKLKEIGSNARLTIERHFGVKVFLELFVKIQPGWLGSDALIAELQGRPSDA